MEKDQIIDHRFNEVDKTRRRSNSNKLVRYYNHNQENYLKGATPKTQSELGGVGSTITGGTG